MEQDSVSAMLLEQATQLNSVAAGLLDVPEMQHRRILANRISEAVMLTTAALNTAAGRWHSDVLSRLRRVAGLRAAEASLPELEKLVSGAHTNGYVTAEEAAPMLERVAAVRGMVDALANGTQAEGREAA